MNLKIVQSVKMNLNLLLNSVDYIGHTGLILSLEESIVLNNSLLLLQNENHFRNIFLWGKILGSNNDYYVAFGYVKDALLGRIYYYSTNMTDWGLLPPPTERGKLLTQLATTSFQGDPALVIDILCEKDDPILNKMFGDVNTTRPLKEEDRLSSTINFINEDTLIVPRGALFKRADAVVVENLAFTGLTIQESREQKSYLHFRESRQKWNTNLLTRRDYNYALDFLDTVDMDIPQGCWTIQIFEGRNVLVRSLYWPGMIFYHMLNSMYYGCLYLGNGKKNLDIPFMLPVIEVKENKYS